MADDVKFVAADWGSGWIHFVINPDNTLTPSGYAQKKDQALVETINLSTNSYPPGFAQADQDALVQLMVKLTREWSKATLKAAAVTRKGQIYWDSEYAPP